MRYEDLEQWERILMKEITTRRSLGGYSPEATTILHLCEISYELCRHLKDKMPRPKAAKGEL